MHADCVAPNTTVRISSVFIADSVHQYNSSVADLCGIYWRDRKCVSQYRCTIRVLVLARLSLFHFRYSERSVIWTDGGCFAAVVNLPCQEQVHLNSLVSVRRLLACLLAVGTCTDLVESHNVVLAFFAAYIFSCLSSIRKRPAWVDSPDWTAVVALPRIRLYICR
jgi:hypothetical protein